MTTQDSSEHKAAPVYFWVAFAILVVAHALRALGHTSPIYGGDEYAYLISGVHRGHLEWLWSRDPMLQKVTNPLYLWVISEMHRLFTDVSAVMRLFNVFVFCATVAWCARWAIVRGGGWSAGLAVLGIVGLLPSSAFTAAVMADVPFYCAVVLTALLVCGRIASHPRSACAGAGVASALAFLTKPHALSIIGATWMFVLVAPYFLKRRAVGTQGWREVIFRSLQSGAIFLLSLYVTLLLFSVFFYDKIIWNPQYPLGVFYANIAGHMSSSGMAAVLNHPLELARYVSANLVSALTVMWPFLMVLALTSHRVLRSASKEDRDWAPVAVFGWLLIAIPFATGMVALFTFSISNGLDGEAWRVHSRYYAFLYIVVIVGALAVKDWPDLLRTRVFFISGIRVDGYSLIAVTWPLMWLLSAWALKDMRVWFQDNVELFHLFPANWRMPHPVTQRLVVGALIFAVLLFAAKSKWIKELFSAALAVAFSAALWEVTCIQHIHSAVIHFRIETGQLVRSVIPEATDDQILIVGTARYGQTAHVLYGMQRPVHVRQLAVGQALDQSMTPQNARYVFAVDNIPIAFPTRVLLSTPAGTLHQMLAPSKQ